MLTELGAVVFLPSPNKSDVRRVRVWCPAMLDMVETRGLVTVKVGLDVLRVERCMFQSLGCACLKDKNKRGLCVVGKEMQTGKW